ncbi:YwdI family protein [Neobacillus sp. FSL H8-0543]|uniref:YwdI family protein n=1 Tax=Neobacillus sp. FSL H8-0543 TaxID=2954672 RepID=UPI003158644F
MNISVDKLLSKIEQELKHAKNSSQSESLRERVYSIKILCELILDEKPVKSETPVTTITFQSAVNQQAVHQPVIGQQVFQQPVSLNQPKKIEMDDEANGDSLLDF